MLHIGCHLSTTNGYLAMGHSALSIGADTFQFFTRNPRGSGAAPINPEDAQALAAFMHQHSFAPILAHASYTLNVCSSSPETRAFAKETMADDLARLEQLPCSLYNFHPGSHTKQGIEIGITHIAECLNALLKPGQKTLVLLETMAGKGTEVGGTFEELGEIIRRVELQEHLGVCLDTCHVHDAGYDIINDLDGVLEKFDRTIGINKLHAVHMNDSMNPMGSKKDRHACIGKGTIGLDALCRIVTHPSLRSLPFFLETRNEMPGYAEEIRMLRNCCP